MYCKVQPSTATILSDVLTTVPHEVEGLDLVTLADLSVLGIPVWDDKGFWPVEPGATTLPPDGYVADGVVLTPDGTRRVVVRSANYRPMTAQEHADASVAKALADLQKTDATMRRVFEAIFAGRVQSSDLRVQEWITYGDMLRKVVSTKGESDYPIRPAYIVEA